MSDACVITYVYIVNVEGKLWLLVVSMVIILMDPLDRDLTSEPLLLFLFLILILLILLLPQEAGHPGALPVCGHGCGGALRQLHVLRGEEEVVRPGRRHGARHQHLRGLHRGAGALRRLAEGREPPVITINDSHFRAVSC